VKLLSRIEEMIMLTVYVLGDDAYGMAIRKHLREVTGKRFSIGAIYVPLERLESKGFLSAEEKSPTPKRGGRSKRFFRVTTEGHSALNAIRQVHASLWENYPDLDSGVISVRTA